MPHRKHPKIQPNTFIPVNNVKVDNVETIVYPAESIRRRVDEASDLTSVRYKKDNDLNLITLYKKCLENKLFAIVLCAYQQHPDATEINIKYRSLSELLGLSHSNYHALKNTCKGIMVCEKRVPRQGKEYGFHFASMFKDILTDVRGEVTFIIQPEVKSIFLKNNPNAGFMSYYLQNLERLKNTFSLRLFEILKMFQKSDTDDGWYNVTYDRLIDLLMITKKSYLISEKNTLSENNRILKDFDRYVLKRAENEVNEHTDIKFTFIRTGSPDGHLLYRFKIKPNTRNIIKPITKEPLFVEDKKSKKPSLPSKEQLSADKTLTERKEKIKELLPNLNANSVKSIASLKVHDSIFYVNLEQVSEKIQAGSVKPANIGGYINSAISNNHAQAKVGNQKVSDAQKDNKDNKDNNLDVNYNESEQSNDDLIKYIKSQYEEYINNAAYDFILNEYETALEIMKESRFGNIKFPSFASKEEASEYFSVNVKKSAPSCMIFKGKMIKQSSSIHSLESFSLKELLIEIKYIDGNLVIGG